MALACVLSGVVGLALAAPRCRDIAGFEQYVQAPGLVVSDMHGTVEAPAFLKDLLCSLLRSDRPVMLALEYPAAQQPFLDDFLHAPQSESAARALLASPFWGRPTQDGRTSRAMLELLLWVREQHARGAPIRLLAFDSFSGGPSQAPAGSAAAFDERDAAMAATLSQAFATLRPHEVPVIFTGNVHARKTKGLPFAPPAMADADPLGHRLKERGFVHLGIAYRGGTIWSCLTADSCGVHDGGTPGPAVRAFSIATSQDPAYDAMYFTGRLTASMPAVAAANKPPR